MYLADTESEKEREQSQRRRCDSFRFDSALNSHRESHVATCNLPFNQCATNQLATRRRSRADGFNTPSLSSPYFAVGLNPLFPANLIVTHLAAHLG